MIILAKGRFWPYSGPFVYDAHVCRVVLIGILPDDIFLGTNYSIPVKDIKNLSIKMEVIYQSEGEIYYTRGVVFLDKIIS